MSFRFHPEAEAEFLAAIDWYEARSSGLGEDFAAEIHAAIRRAVVLPLAWPRVDGEFAACWPAVFPTACCTYRAMD